MKKVRELTEPELITLRSAHENHPCAGVRDRAQVTILGDKGYPLKKMADICRMVRRTVSAVIDSWEVEGLRGLYDNPRPGRPRSLTPDDEEFVHKMAEEEPRNINKIIAVTEAERGKKVGKSTVKRVMKKKRTWKRIRKSLKGKRDDGKFEKARERIADLEKRRENGEIDVRCFDESGFSPVPCVPYAWQPKGGHGEVPSSAGPRLNVLAFMNKDNEFRPFIFEGGGTDADVVIACFDNFAGTVSKKTFVLIDNSPVHKSKKFLKCLPGWHEKGLNVKFLPTYSPELNLIEILWKKIRYEWLPFSACISFRKLTECIDDILSNPGSQYTINFV
jgi:transposase